MKKRFLSAILICCAILGGCSTADEKKSVSNENTQETDAEGDISLVSSDASEKYTVPKDIIPDEKVTFDVYSQLSNYSGSRQVGLQKSFWINSM